MISCKLLFLDNNSLIIEKSEFSSHSTTFTGIDFMDGIL